MKLSVIVVTYNSASTISDCIASINQQRIPTSIIIVDNASTDDTLHILKKTPALSFIKNKQNIGYAAANNQGIDKALSAGSDYVLILNPDTKLLPFALKELVSTAKQVGDKGIFGPKMYADLRQKILWSAGGALDPVRYSAALIGTGEKDHRQYESVKTVTYISGTCMLLPRRLLDMGLRFWENYFMYYEDVELCVRAQKRGFSSIYVPVSALVHSERSQQLPYASLKNYYLARNHLLFVARNAPIGIQLRESLRIPKTIWEHYRSHDEYALQGIRDAFLFRYGKCTPSQKPSRPQT